MQCACLYALSHCSATVNLPSMLRSLPFGCYVLLNIYLCVVFPGNVTCQAGSKLHFVALWGFWLCNFLSCSSPLVVRTVWWEVCSGLFGKPDHRGEALLYRQHKRNYHSLLKQNFLKRRCYHTVPNSIRWWWWWWWFDRYSFTCWLNSTSANCKVSTRKWIRHKTIQIHKPILIVTYGKINFSRYYRAIFGPKLYGSPGNPRYRSTTGLFLSWNAVRLFVL